MNAERKRDLYLQRTYGITLEQYGILLGHKDGGCWICGKVPKEGQKPLHVEHDHKTGQIRGLACWHCNTLLQKGRDNPDILASAADYLRRQDIVNILLGRTDAAEESDHPDRR